MTSDYVTRIASAIANRRQYPWDDLRDDERKDLCSDALAALEAAMEPDEAMIEAGKSAALEWLRNSEGDNATATIFRAMIKHALTEGSPKILIETPAPNAQTAI